MAEPATLPLDDWLCLSLYTASRAMTAHYRPLLEGLGLTYAQYLVMSALWEDGPARLGVLADRLRLDSGTLSPLVARLERGGLVRRDADPTDDRVTVVRLTSRGSRLRSKATGIPQAICDASGLDADQMGALVDQLKELVERLDR